MILKYRLSNFWSLVTGHGLLIRRAIKSYALQTNQQPEVVSVDVE